MVVVASVMVAMGVAMVVLGGTSALGFFNNTIDPTFWGDAGVTGPAADYRAWIFAVLGATWAGWSVTMIVLIRHGIAHGLRWAWNAVPLARARGATT